MARVVKSTERVTFGVESDGPHLWLRSAYDYSHVVAQQVCVMFDVFGHEDGHAPYFSFTVQRVRPDERAGPLLVHCNVVTTNHTTDRISAMEEYMEGSLAELLPADTALLIDVSLDVLSLIPTTYAKYVAAIRQTPLLKRLLGATVLAVKEDAKHLETAPHPPPGHVPTRTEPIPTAVSLKRLADGDLIEAATRPSKRARKHA